MRIIKKLHLVIKKFNELIFKLKDPSFTEQSFINKIVFFRNLLKKITLRIISILITKTVVKKIVYVLGPIYKKNLKKFYKEKAFIHKSNNKFHKKNFENFKEFESKTSKILSNRVADWSLLYFDDKFANNKSAPKGNILQLTTYQLENPDHGGKLRSFHLKNSLKNKFNIFTLSIEWDDVIDLSSLAIKIDKKDVNGLLYDILICKYLEENDSIYKAIIRKIDQINPSLIILEQPFLWPIIKRAHIERVINSTTRVIYSSHNIETDLKQIIYQSNFSSNETKRYLTMAKYLEKSAIRNSDIAIAVSQKDSQYIKNISPGKHVEIFKNGSSKPLHNSKNKIWEEKFMQFPKNWVFIGSWHQPNISGVISLIDSINSLNINKQNNFAFWVIGGVGGGILNERSNILVDNKWLQITGPVSSEDIDSAILLSSGIILPIWEGGGSNLKTAQALLSEKCVISSKIAFRSFEDSINENGVYLSDNPSGLANLMCSIEPDNRYSRSEEIRKLDWNNIFETLPSLIERVQSKNHQ